MLARAGAVMARIWPTPCLSVKWEWRHQGRRLLTTFFPLFSAGLRGQRSGLVNTTGGGLNRMNVHLKNGLALIFSGIFLGLSLFLMVLAGYDFVNALLSGGQDVIAVVVKSINVLIISLAVFELGIGVGKEYAGVHHDENIYLIIRRTMTRFVGTACIALVLEALIMVIKYSQLDLAGNLFYPVGIILGASGLLMALGVFLRLTQGHTE
jgi:hypothetical protein